MHESPQAGHATQATLTGDLLRTERGPFATIALCVTGLLPIVSVAEALGRLLLKWKRTATITYDGHAFVVVSETTLLGKPLRKDRWFVGTDVLVCLHESACVRVGIDGWQDVRDISTEPTAIGLHVARIASSHLRAAQHIEITWMYTKSAAWVGKDYTLRVADRSTGPA